MNVTTPGLIYPENRRLRRCALLLLAATVPAWTGATAPEISPPSTRAAESIDELTEIMVEAREPRWVAPTRSMSTI